MEAGGGRREDIIDSDQIWIRFLSAIITSLCKHVTIVPNTMLFSQFSLKLATALLAQNSGCPRP